VPSRPVALLAAGTDVVHGVSMLVAAGIWPPYRRAALSSAAVAGIAAAHAAAIAATSGTGRPARGHLRLVR
jgi:hypothetical protein